MPYVERAYVYFKRGDRDKVVELAREGAKLFPGDFVIRHYTADMGVPLNTFVFEVEFPTYAAYEEAWQTWGKSEEVAEFMGRWNAVVTDTKHEMWIRHELPE